MRLMRLPVHGAPPEMVLEEPFEDFLDFKCPVELSAACVLSRRGAGKEMVFFSLDPVRGRGERIAKIELKTGPNAGSTASAAGRFPPMAPAWRSWTHSRASRYSPGRTVRGAGSPSIRFGGHLIRSTGRRRAAASTPSPNCRALLICCMLRLPAGWTRYWAKARARPKPSVVQKGTAAAQSPRS